MTKYQKVIYKTAKLVCKDKSYKTLFSCYKARLKDSKHRKCTFIEILEEYKGLLKWSTWWNTYNWVWNEEKGHAEWINKITGINATQEDCDCFNNK